MWSFGMRGKPIKSNEPQRNEVSQVYKARLKPISKDKNVAAIIEKMANHIERKNNIDFEMDEKRREIAALKEQADSLASQYNFDLNRETMRAKVEVEKEAKLIEEERVALLKIQSHSMNNWRIEIKPEEVRLLEQAYEPIGVKERELLSELQQRAMEYVAAFNSFKKEYDKNTEIHNTLVGLVGNASTASIKLNRVREDEVFGIVSKVNSLD